MADVLIRYLRGHAEAGRLPSPSPAPRLLQQDETP